MKTQVFCPKNTTVKSLVEFYFLVEAGTSVEIKTIPNGRVNASIVLEGALKWFFERSRKFEALSASTLYPLTRTVGQARFKGPGRCIGVQFYPHILALPVFEKKALRGPLSFDEFFMTPAGNQQLIADLKRANSIEDQARLLDDYFFRQFFGSVTTVSWIQRVSRTLESGSSTPMKIREIAQELGISIKTLERRFQKTIGLTPKSFAAIIRLHQTARSIRKKNPIISHGDLSEALGNGYYDQSHFIKSCLRITGLTPKKLFTRFPEQITDVVIGK